MTYCKNCGAEFKDNSGFCRSCGYDAEYNSSETDDEILFPEEDFETEKVSKLEKKQEQILAEGILSLVFAIWIFPIGFVLAVKNIKRVKEFQKNGDIKGKALTGYVLSKIAKIWCIVLLAMLGVMAILMISALLQ